MNKSRIPKMITLIGSTETGRQVMAQGSSSVKTYSLELGGNAPAILMEDADVDLAADLIVKSQVCNTGQTCIGYNRIYVHEKRYEEFCQKVLDRLKKVTIGAGRDDGEMVMGPMISFRERDRVLDLIADAKARGAKVLCGGDVPAGFEKGAYISPTVVADVNEDMKISREEIFGPVVTIQTFETEQEAIDLANDTDYGLAGAVFTNDGAKALRVIKEIRAGITWINCYNPAFCEAPWGGYKMSGIGRELGTHGLEEYCETKQININLDNEQLGWYNN